ncbi:hypothetical protein KP509_14G058800 [Ceratopteris richardii]|uniref:Uncharacterized protein n=1 Tax=Ceratopteris richardii TaxID=49495 RepID=A0A8T2T8A9_CERRI|nr:hypothetical protein KP509_14G058800 [Ceratopteris richardii]
MSFEDQRCLGLYLLEVHRHRDTLLRRAGGRQSQRQITDFFTPDTGQLEEQSVEHLVQSSVHTHTATTGTLIDRTVELGRSRRPRVRGGASQYRRRLQRRIRAVLFRRPQCR